MRAACLILFLAIAGTDAVLASEPGEEAAAARMAVAADAFLDSLTPELRAKAALPFDDSSRGDWHYIPRERVGVAFKEMNDTQRTAAKALLRSALSSNGAKKVEEIMALEAVLHEIEKGPEPPRRDPLKYWIAVFGDPDAAAESRPWAWKLEGHHVSLNFTGLHQHASVTPYFLGSNPAEIPHGERSGTRVLAAQEDLARELLASLSVDQRRAAIVGETAPDDILASPRRSIEEVDSSGLGVSAMSEPQRALVKRLLDVYADNLQPDLADHERARISAAGFDNLRFAWMGSDQRGKGHYYRLSGPTFVIEYDNTQGNANHVHTVWRDRQRDFGRDLLEQHYQKDHSHK